MERSERIQDAVRRMAEAATQISLAVKDVNEFAGEISTHDLTPETRLQWEGFVAALGDALKAAQSMLNSFPKVN